MKKALLLLVASLSTLALFADANAGTKLVVSGSQWEVFDANGWKGYSQNVCQNASYPSNCSAVSPQPDTPILYGRSGGGWNAQIPAIAGAKWMWWTPSDFTPATPAGPARFTFKSKDFHFCDPPVGGTIYVAADNRAEVFINGKSLSAGQPSSTDHDQIKQFSVPASYLNGSSVLLGLRANSIEVHAENDPVSPGPPPDYSTYKTNPAGVLLGASFEYAGDPPCAGYKGGEYKMEEFERLADCPPGKYGEGQGHTCLCGFWVDTDKCLSLPPTCTGYTYSDWSACGTNNQKTRVVTGNSPAGCTGTPSTQPDLTDVCPIPTCNFTYTEWEQCQPPPGLSEISTQIRTVLTSSPAGCTGGTPETTKSCTYVPPLVDEGDRCWDKDRANQGQYAYVGTCPTGTKCKKRTSCHQECFLWIFCKTVCSGDTTATSSDMHCLP